jgi:LysR family nitrogen assimilation transcriptional regulator
LVKAAGLPFANDGLMKYIQIWHIGPDVYELDMEIRQLRYFVRIVDLGSFSKAARELFVAQPALSKQIKMLESQLGAVLLNRTVRGVEATESGLLFYRNAQAVLRQLERVAGEIKDLTGNPSGVVTLGIPQSPASILAAPLVCAVRKRYPGIQLQIREGVTGILEEMVLSGRLDMSLLFDRPSRAQHLRAIPLLTESLYLVTPAGHGSGKATITLKEASGFDFVLPGTANTTRQIIEDVFHKNDLALNILAEVDAVSTMKSIIRSGLGATILSSSGLSQAGDGADLTVRKIVSPELRRGVSLCSYDIAALSMASQAVFDMVPAVVRKLVNEAHWQATLAT